MKSAATMSPCGVYRYWLERSWRDWGGDYVNFIMLNPSTADASQDDPTIRKCIGFAKKWGFIGVHVVNIFALRSTDPAALADHRDPIGPENDAFIRAGVLSAAKTIVAWGTHGRLRGRAEQVAKMLDPSRTFALRINQDGSPQHPLYVPYDVGLVPWPRVIGGGK